MTADCEETYERPEISVAETHRNACWPIYGKQAAGVRGDRRPSLCRPFRLHSNRLGAPFCPDTFRSGGGALQISRASKPERNPDPDHHAVTTRGRGGSDE